MFYSLHDKACEVKQTDVVYQCVERDCGFLSDRWTVTEGAWARQGWTRGTKAPTQLIVLTCQRSKSQQTMATEHERSTNGQWKSYFSSDTLADFATIPFHDDSEVLWRSHATGWRKDYG